MKRLRTLKRSRGAPLLKLLIALTLWVGIGFLATRVLVNGQFRNFEYGGGQVAGEQVTEVTNEATNGATIAQATNSARGLEEEKDLSLGLTLTTSPPPEVANGDKFSGTTERERLPERLYVGPAFTPATVTKELLFLNFDSPPSGDWRIEEEEGTQEIRWLGGKGFKLGKLKLAGGEIFTYSGTLSFWLKMETIPSTGEEQPLLVWNFNEGGQSAFAISFASRQLIFSVTDEEGNQEGIDPELKDPYSWHYVVATWDLTKEPFLMTLNIDGEKQVERGFPFEPKIPEKPLFQIGGKFGELSPAVFSVDEIILTNWAKSEQEITGGQ